MQSIFRPLLLGAILIFLGGYGAGQDLMDRDFDDLTDVEEDKLKSSKTDRDTDGDGLWDGWEHRQAMLEVSLKDAALLKRDVFVEIDAMKGVVNVAKLEEFKNECKLIEASFARHQINLHLEWDDMEVPLEEKISTKGPAASPQGRWGQIRDANFRSVKNLTHRHALIVKSYDKPEIESASLYPEEGQSLTIQANDHLRKMAVTFMRALGKTLGLAPGGLIPGYGTKFVRDESREKPNHFSVMNEAFPEGVERNGAPPTYELIYQEFDLQLPLDELKILESDGIGRSGAHAEEMSGLISFNRDSDPAKKVQVRATMDWNQNGSTGDVLRNIDLNRTGNEKKLTKHRPTLNEWSRLQFSAGSIGRFKRYLAEFPEPETLDP